eukprot:1161654-Pelagomonas_calceolata.AAC.12
MHLLFQSDSIQVHVGPAHLLAIAVPVRHDSAVHQSLLAFRATCAANTPPQSDGTAKSTHPQCTQYVQEAPA